MEGTTINLIIMTGLVLWGLYSLGSSWFKRENGKEEQKASREEKNDTFDN